MGRDGSAQSGRRSGGPVREREAELEQAGVSGCWARIETSTENPFPFSFSKISKHFQLILNPILNLNQTTHHKNSNATA
jgi:hypothetical protein